MSGVKRAQGRGQCGAGCFKHKAVARCPDNSLLSHERKLYIPSEVRAKACLRLLSQIIFDTFSKSSLKVCKKYNLILKHNGKLLLFFLMVDTVLFRVRASLGRHYLPEESARQVNQAELNIPRMTRGEAPVNTSLSEPGVYSRLVVSCLSSSIHANNHAFIS